MKKTRLGKVQRCMFQKVQRKIFPVLRLFSWSTICLRTKAKFFMTSEQNFKLQKWNYDAILQISNPQKWKYSFLYLKILKLPLIPDSIKYERFFLVFPTFNKISFVTFCCSLVLFVNWSIISCYINISFKFQNTV